MKKIFLYFLAVLFVFFPKNKRIIVFGERNGLRFADNSRYLLLFLKKNYKKKFRLIWITRNKSLVKSLTKERIECFYYESIKGIYFQLVSYWHIYNYSENDIHPILTRFSNNINLWHGALIKKIDKFKKNKSLLKRIIFTIYLNFINIFFKRYFFYPNLKYINNLKNHFPKNFYTYLDLIFKKFIF